ncbi:MAG: glycosyltransferase [Anaerolineaceae bacterium]|nr:glycosyltransferase [Anaerolineaceae bacterium]
MKSSGYPNRSRDSFSLMWVVIPTYWGKTDAGVYDHPTPLGGESTLPKLLDSLLQQECLADFSVLILVSATSSEHEGEVTALVRELLTRYDKKLNLFLADVESSRALDQELTSHGLELGIASMRGYAAVRNMQLLIPMMMGAEMIIAVDDDEVLPRNYLRQARKWIGKIHNGQRVTGIGGPYLDASGNPYIAQAEKVSNRLIDKSVFMNQTMHQLMAGPDELTKTPMVFGGNMVFHRDLFTQVGFDPAITRGEDIDYLINARIAGHSFYFDPELTITHLPPRHFESPQYAKMRQDVIRFIYEREKMRLHHLPATDFAPYPGYLLGDNFDAVALDALHIFATSEMMAKFDTPKEILLFAQGHARELAPQYKIFAEHWQKAVEVLESQVARDALRQLIVI